MNLLRLVPHTVKEKLLYSRTGKIWAQIYGHTIGWTEVNIKTNTSEFTLLVPAKSSYTRDAESSRSFEPSLINDLQSRVHTDTIYYDVGARFGFSTRAVVAMGVPEQGCHAFEASRFYHYILNKNHAGPTNQTFVGDGRDGTTSLDKYTDHHPAPDIIKIDVEGAELEVIKGAKALLEEHRPLLYVEVHPHMLTPGTATTLLSFLEGVGYDISILEHHSSNTQWKNLSENIPQDEFLARCTIS